MLTVFCNCWQQQTTPSPQTPNLWYVCQELPWNMHVMNVSCEEEFVSELQTVPASHQDVQILPFSWKWTILFCILLSCLIRFISTGAWFVAALDFQLLASSRGPSETVEWFELVQRFRLGFSCVQVLPSMWKWSILLFILLWILDARILQAGFARTGKLIKRNLLRREGKQQLIQKQAEYWDANSLTSRRSMLATFQPYCMVPTGLNPVHNSNRSLKSFSHECSLDASLISTWSGGLPCHYIRR